MEFMIDLKVVLFIESCPNGQGHCLGLVLVLPLGREMGCFHVMILLSECVLITDPCGLFHCVQMA